MSGVPRIPLWSIVLIVIALIAVRAIVEAEPVETIPYSEFKARVHEGKVADITILDDRVYGTLRESAKPGERFQSYRVADPGLVGELEAAHVTYSAQLENKWLVSILSWVVPAVIFVGAWAWFARRMGGGGAGLMAIGKSKARVYVEKETGVTLSTRPRDEVPAWRGCRRS